MILYLLVSCSLTEIDDNEDHEVGFAITEFILGMAASRNTAVSYQSWYVLLIVLKYLPKGSPITVINGYFTTKISGSIDYLTIRVSDVETAIGLKRVLSEQKITSTTAWYRRIINYFLELKGRQTHHQYLIMEAKSVVGELRGHLPQVVAQTLCL